MLATALSFLAEEAGHGEEVANPVLPILPEVVWGAIAFFGLLILMNSVLLPPLRQAMQRRSDQLRSDNEAAEKAVVAAEQVRRDYDATLAEARAEATRIIDAARTDAEALRAEKVRAATDEVAAMRQTALAELETERNNALSSMRGDIAQIAVAAASKVVGQPLDVTANQSVVDSHVNRAGDDA